MVLKRKRPTVTVNEVLNIPPIDNPATPTRLSQKHVGSMLPSKISKKIDSSTSSVIVKKKIPGPGSSTKIFKSTMDSPNISKQASTSAPKKSGVFVTSSNVLKKKVETTKIIERKKKPTKKNPKVSKNGRKKSNTRGKKNNNKESAKRKKSGKKDKDKKKKKKKKDQEQEQPEPSEEEDSEESDSDESIANGGTVCRNCSRGTVEQLDPCAGMHDLELPEFFSLEKADE